MILIKLYDTLYCLKSTYVYMQINMLKYQTQIFKQNSTLKFCVINLLGKFLHNSKKILIPYYIN